MRVPLWDEDWQGKKQSHISYYSLDIVWYCVFATFLLIFCFEGGDVGKDFGVADWRRASIYNLVNVSRYVRT